MGTQYRHLNEMDRVKIDTLRTQGHSIAKIAKIIGFHRSTVDRELKRGTRDNWQRYLCVFGQRNYDQKRKEAGLKRRKLTSDTQSPLWKTVIAGLKDELTPELLAGRLKLFDAPHQVSHETIYKGIYNLPRGTIRSELVKLLPWSRSGRRVRGRVKRRFTGIQTWSPSINAPHKSMIARSLATPKAILSRARAMHLPSALLSNAQVA